MENFSNSASFAPVFEPNKRRIWPIVLVIVIVILLGGGVGAYFYYFNQPAPEEVMKKMFNNLTEINSLKYEGSVKIEAKDIDTTPFLGGVLGGAPALGASDSKPLGLVAKSEVKNTQDVGLNITLSGFSDFFNSDNLKSEIVYKVQTDMPFQNFTLGLNTKIIGDVTYLSFSELPQLGLFDLSFLKNQWIKFDQGSFAKALGSLGGGLEEKLVENKQKTKEAVEKFKIVLKNKPFLVVSSVLSEEKINNEKTFHYKVKVDKENLVEFLKELEKNIQGRELLPEEQKSFDEIINSVKEVEGDLWVGKKDYLPRKIVFEGFTDADKKIKYSFDLQLNNFNQPMQIEAPAQSFPLDEMLQSIFGGLGSLQSKTATGTLEISDESLLSDLDADADGLTDVEEKTVWLTDYLKADTDGDGFNDGVEVKNGFNPNGPGKLQ